MLPLSRNDAVSFEAKLIDNPNKIAAITLDQDILMKILQSLNLKDSELKLALLQQPDVFYPKKVVFEFGDIKELSTTSASQLSYRQIVNNKPVKGMTSNFDEGSNQFTYSFYYDFSIYGNHEEYILAEWESDVIQALFASTLSNRPFEYKELGEFETNLQVDSFVLIKIDKYVSLIKEIKQNFSKFARSIASNKVYAYCSGYFACGTIDEVCTPCSPGSCNNTVNPARCPDGSSCSCTNECVGNYAKSCSVRDSAYLCANLSPVCWGGCVASSSCSWSGAPDPTPDPSAPPPPGGGETTCWRCVNNQACDLTTSNAPCGCESCTTETSKKALYLFDDSINENGVWEPDQGEKRITSNNNSNCTNHGNVMYLAGANLIVGTNTITDQCNIGENEYPGDACQDTRQCGSTSGSYWTPIGGTTVLNVEKTCFAEKTCSCGACTWPNTCQSEKKEGSVCRQDSRYCDSNNWQYNLKSGPYALVTRETNNNISIGAQFPIGWRPSAFAPSSGNWSSTNGSCTGAIGYGLVLNQEKSCTVSPVNTDTTTAGAPFTLTVTGYSTQANESVALTLIRKQPAPSIAPTNVQWPYVPNGPTEAHYPPPPSDRYYYNYTTNCTAGNSAAPCSRQVVIDNLPVGEYYAFCALNTQNPIRCTGNPNCTHEGLGGAIDCSTTGYESCSTGSPDDNATIKVVCSPVCTPACGQDNGCGTNQFCGTSDDAPPPMPNPMSSRDIVVTTPNTVPSSHYATINWSTGPLIPPNNGPTTRYELVIAQRNAAFNPTTAWQTCNAPVNLGGCGLNFTSCDATTNGIPHRCVRHNATLTYNYFPSAAMTNQVNFYARAANTSCTSYTSSHFSSFSAAREYNLLQTISGNIYQDNGANGTPLCTSASKPTALAPPAGTTIAESKTGAVQTFLGIGSAYSFTGTVPYSPYTWLTAKSTVSLVLPPPSDPANALVCTCPSSTNGCEYTDISSPQATVDFFLTTVDLSTVPWWQTVNGLLYAARGAITSIIPTECIDGTTEGPCTPYLITQDKTIQTNQWLGLSAGIPMSGAGDVLGASKTAWLTERTPQAWTSEATTHTQLLKEDFAYFQSKVDYATLQTLPTLNGEIQAAPATKTYYKHVGDLRIRPGNTPWRIQSGETLVIFVEGNITFQGDFTTSDALTQVEQGGFLAFISDGEIIFDSNVGTIDPTDFTPTVEGVFIADQKITVQAASASNIMDKHFVGAGTFVAWVEGGVGDGFVFDRNYSDNGLGALKNKSYPTESFIFRPDFTINMPDELKTTSVFWQEVN